MGRSFLSFYLSTKKYFHSIFCTLSFSARLHLYTNALVSHSTSPPTPQWAILENFVLIYQIYISLNSRIFWEKAQAKKSQGQNKNLNNKSRQPLAQSTNMLFAVSQSMHNFERNSPLWAPSKKSHKHTFCIRVDLYYDLFQYYTIVSIAEYCSSKGSHFSLQTFSLNVTFREILDYLDFIILILYFFCVCGVASK